MTDNNDKKAEETRAHVEGLLASMTVETRAQVREKLYAMIDERVTEDDPVVKVIGRDFCVRHQKAAIDKELERYSEDTGLFESYVYNSLVSNIANAVLAPKNRAEDEIKVEHSRIAMRVLNQAPEDRALWVWTQAVQAVLPLYIGPDAREVVTTGEQAMQYAAQCADAVLVEARKRFGGIL